MLAPLVAIGVNELQVPSGVGVSPVRTLIAMLVFAGRVSSQVMAPQLTA